jgi:NAD(P)-dependent dehydrogenase (short-subunit alcohol dehydrogenase family)
MGILDLFRLDNKAALVTGSGQGIGRTYALALAEAGADVLIADINEKTGPLVVEEIRALGRKSIFVRTDVTNEADVQSMVDAAVAEFGCLDIAVNNAWTGGRSGSFNGRKTTAETMPLDEWDFIHNLLLRAVLICSQAEALAMMKGGRGKIINMASMSAHIANANVAYCSAKAGVVALSKRLAAEWGSYNINVNCISPSYTLSPARRKDPQENRDLIRSLHPMGWHQRPEDLAGTLVYLASNASNYVTGQEVLVDGGHTLNVWLAPLDRAFPPLVSAEEETRALIRDLDILGIPHDENGVTVD